jgi:tetratricopeptide (TPR) repeat protein
MLKLKPRLLCLGLVVTAIFGAPLPTTLPSQAQFYPSGTTSNRSLSRMYVQRGRERLNRKDFQGAVADFTQALRFTPNDGNILGARGMVLAILQDYRGAMADLDLAIRLNPGNPSLYYGRGVVRERLQDSRGALSDYEQALRLKPGYSDASERRERLSRKFDNVAVPKPPIPAPFPAPTTAGSRPRPVQPAVPAAPVAANTPSVNVYRIANQTTVRIDGQNPGSGVIIARSGHTYYVLTAKHVVATPDEYVIVTASGRKFPIDYKEVKKFTNLDLAVIEFKSKEDLAVAQLANSEQVGQGDSIFVSGWPAVSQGLTRASHQVTDGRITGFQQGDADGYELTYSNPTGGGMSGGPVFNTNGQVIGIHGRAAGNQEVGKIGINLGIPTHLFLRQASQAGLNLRQLGLQAGK